MFFQCCVGPASLAPRGIHSKSRCEFMLSYSPATRDRRLWRRRWRTTNRSDERFLSAKQPALSLQPSRFSVGGRRHIPRVKSHPTRAHEGPTSASYRFARRSARPHVRDLRFMWPVSVARADSRTALFTSVVTTDASWKPEFDGEERQFSASSIVRPCTEEFKNQEI